MESTEKFQLDRDGAKAKIRFLYKSLDEIVVIKNTKQSEQHKYGFGRIQIPIFNVDKDCHQIWERGVFAYRMLEDIYGKYEDVPSKVFEVTRHGNADDLSTYYICNMIK